MTDQEKSENWYFGIDPASNNKYKCIQKSHSQILRMTAKKRDRIQWTGYADKSGQYHRLPLNWRTDEIN